MQYRRLSLAIVLVALLCLGACGQKGPLYLPDDPSSQTAKKN
ncbi:MAG: lipoprotein [Thiotrichales bacterium]